MKARFGQFITAIGAAGMMFAACQVQHQVTPTPSEETLNQQGAKEPWKQDSKPVKKEKPAPVETTPAEKPQYEPVVVGPYVPQTPGKRVSHVSVPGPYVALTFDDGPHSVYTPRILNILRSHGAHATFFVAGENVDGRRKSILARAAAEGHEIGAHTFSHINMSRSSDEKIDREMSRTNEAIKSATGRRPVVMRPPYGATSARLVDKMYKDYGMSTILWDVDTQDWKHPGVSTVISRAVNRAKPGSIILVHDIHGSTADAVEGIVTGLQERGFKLVTVSELIALGGGSSAPVPAAPSSQNPDGQGATEPGAAEATVPAATDAEPESKSAADDDDDAGQPETEPDNDTVIE